MQTICSDHFKDDDSVIVTWNEPSKAAAPIRIQIGDYRAVLQPSTPTLAPATVADFLVNHSAYDVTAEPVASEPEPDEEPAPPANDGKPKKAQTPAQAS